MYGLDITVCHYPPGASKWNPVEHRFFSFVSMEWRARSLVPLDFMKKKIEATTTRTGLTVKAIVNDKIYEKGIKISEHEFVKVNVHHHGILPNWNYTIGLN